MKQHCVCAAIPIVPSGILFQNSPDAFLMYNEWVADRAKGLLAELSPGRDSHGKAEQLCPGIALWELKCHWPQQTRSLYLFCIIQTCGLEVK